MLRLVSDEGSTRSGCVFWCGIDDADTLATAVVSLLEGMLSLYYYFILFF